MAQTTQITQDDSLGPLSELSGGDPMDRIDADMKHVLDALAGMGARPLELTTPASARRQPKLKDAVAAILARQGRGASDDGVATEDITLDGADGELAGAHLSSAGIAVTAQSDNPLFPWRRLGHRRSRQP